MYVYMAEVCVCVCMCVEHTHTFDPFIKKFCHCTFIFFCHVFTQWSENIYIYIFCLSLFVLRCFNIGLSSHRSRNIMNAPSFVINDRVNMEQWRSLFLFRYCQLSRLQPFFFLHSISLFHFLFCSFFFFIWCTQFSCVRLIYFDSTNSFNFIFRRW